MSKAQLITAAGNPVVLQGSGATTYVSGLLLKRFQVMESGAPRGLFYVVDHDNPDLVTRERSDDTPFALLATSEAAVEFVKHLAQTPFKAKFNHVAVLKTFRQTAVKPPTLSFNEFKVFEPKPTGPFAGTAPLLVIVPPQPWGYIALKVEAGGPVYITNIVNAEAPQYRGSSEPVLTVAKRLWHLAQQCGMTAEAWRLVEPLLPPSHKQPPIKELNDMAKPAPVTKKTPAVSKKAPPAVTAKPTPKTKAKAAEKPFEGGVPEAEHAAAIAKSAKKAPAPKAAAKAPAAAPASAVLVQRSGSVSGRIKELILAAKLDDDAIWATVQKEFSLPDEKRSYIAWNRADLRKKGLLPAPAK